MPGHIFNLGLDDPDRSESHLHWLLAFRGQTWIGATNGLGAHFAIPFGPMSLQ
jgi:hypothetical protein